MIHTPEVKISTAPPPERALWRAVLSQVLKDATCQDGVVSQDAIRWLKTYDDNFKFVCECCDLNPQSFFTFAKSFAESCQWKKDIKKQARTALIQSNYFDGRLVNYLFVNKTMFVHLSDAQKALKCDLSHLVKHAVNFRTNGKCSDNRFLGGRYIKFDLIKNIRSLPEAKIKDWLDWCNLMSSLKNAK